MSVNRNVLKLLFFLTTFVVFVDGLAAMKTLQRSRSTNDLDKICNFTKEQISSPKAEFMDSPSNISPRQKSTNSPNYISYEANLYTKEDELKKIKSDFFLKNKELQDITKKIKIYEKTMSDLHQNIDQKEQELIQYQEEKNKNNKLNQKATILENNIFTLRTKLSETESELRDQKNINKTISSDIKKLKNQNLNIEIKKKEGESFNRLLTKENLKLQKQEKKFSYRVNSLQKALEQKDEEMTLEKISIENQKKNFENDKTIYVDKIKSLEADINSLKNQLDKIAKTDENIIFEEDLTRDHKSIAELAIDDLFATKVQEKNAILEQQKIDLENEIKKFKSRIDSLDKMITALGDQIKTLNTENNSLKEKNRNQTQNYDRLGKDFSENQRFCKEKSEEITNLKENIAINDEQINYFEQKNKELQNKITSLETQINQLQSNHGNNDGSDDPEKNKQIITELRETIEKLKILLNENKNQRQTLTSELETSKKKEFEATNKIKLLESKQAITGEPTSKKSEKNVHYVTSQKVVPTWMKFTLGFFGLTTIIALMTAYIFYDKNKGRNAKKEAA